CSNAMRRVRRIPKKPLPVDNPGHTKRARAGSAPGAGPSAGRSVLVEVDRALDGRRAVGDRVRLRDALEGELGGLRRRVLVLGVEALGAHDHDLTGLELVVQ